MTANDSVIVTMLYDIDGKEKVWEFVVLPITKIINETKTKGKFLQMLLVYHKSNDFSYSFSKPSIIVM